jgi:two-component system chemotaxis sensor kinase CheA
MDTSEYMPMFLAEAREHLQELNLAVVKLEENPHDRPTVDGIFRIAHSLKGMSATMGFAQIAALTHEMEDVFELLRQRGAGLSVEAINTVFVCLDALSAAVESIESEGSEQLDPAPIVARLRALVRARTPEQQVERAGGAEIPENETLAAARAAGARVLHVIVTLDDEVMMPAVRAHMVLAGAADLGELLGSIPTSDGVDRFEGHLIEAWIATDRPEADLSAAVLRVSDVASAQVTELADDEPARPQQAPAFAASDTPVTARTTSGGGESHAARTVRVDAERLDALMHMMGELVIHRTAVEALAAGLGSTPLQQAVQQLTRSSQELQSLVMQVRMIPVDVVFLRFPRLVRDLSSKLGKDVELELIGRETELDRTVVDALGDPLVHLVRNALDHGLESPDERRAAGKPRVGKVQIAARHAGGSVVIEVRDDGHGIDPKAVARKAHKQGLIDAETADALDIRGAVELLFTAGFSTAETTSDISGRGVGMDAVRAKIRELGGEVTLDSKPGQGTLAQIRLPLTLAIVSALQVDVAGVPFAIPLDRVERTLRLADHSVRSVGGRRVLVLDDGVVPLIESARAFGRDDDDPAHPRPTHELAVLVRGQDRRLGLAVDLLVGQRELVTRPLPPIVSDGQPVSGGAVLADGQIALIVDCDALASDLINTGVTAPAATPLAA